jgi:DNA-binding PadR family transcriptional regulator
MEKLLQQELIERRRPRSHLPKSRLYRLTAKGLKAQRDRAGGIETP